MVSNIRRLNRHAFTQAFKTSLRQKHTNVTAMERDARQTSPSREAIRNRGELGGRA